MRNISMQSESFEELEYADISALYKTTSRAQMGVPSNIVIAAPMSPESAKELRRLVLMTTS